MTGCCRFSAGCTWRIQTRQWGCVKPCWRNQSWTPPSGSETRLASWSIITVSRDACKRWRSATIYRLLRTSVSTETRSPVWIITAREKSRSRISSERKGVWLSGLTRWKTIKCLVQARRVLYLVLAIKFLVKTRKLSGFIQIQSSLKRDEFYILLSISF